MVGIDFDPRRRKVSITTSDYLTERHLMLFGTIVQGLLAGVIKSLREEMTP